MTYKNGNYYLIDLGEMRRLVPSEMKNPRAVVDDVQKSEGSRITGYGSDAYKAPEKMVSDPQINAELDWKKSDTYSMGLTLASIILGKQPEELSKACTSAQFCKLPSVGLTPENFQQINDYAAQVFVNNNPNASKIKRAAMKLALSMISVKPSDRPNNMEDAHKAFIKRAVSSNLPQTFRGNLNRNIYAKS